MLNLDFTLREAEPARAPLMRVQRTFERNPSLEDPAYVLGRQVQDLFLWMRHIQDPSPNGPVVRMAGMGREIFLINLTLEHLRFTPIFPTEWDLELFRDHRRSG